MSALTSQFRCERYLTSSCRGFNTTSKQHVHTYSTHATGPNTISDFYDKSVQIWATKKPRTQSLKEYCKDGPEINPERILDSAKYLQEELPIRLARELRNLEMLPFIAMTNPHISKVHEIYTNAFKELLDIPEIKTIQHNNDYLLPVLDRIVRGTVNIVELLGKGLREVSVRIPPEKLNLQSFMDYFLISRIARRVMAQHHVMLHHQRPNMVGIISLQCSPLRAIENVTTILQEISERNYGLKPDIKISGDRDFTFPFISSHLEYILLELLKNSTRSTIEHQRKQTKFHFPDLPPIEVLIASGPEKLTIRISDSGGGISEEDLKHIWKYGFTTMKSNDSSTPSSSGLGILTAFEEIHSPMAGLGFGLPLSRLYAKHFGGDLRISSMEGYGTDAYLSLDSTGEVLELEL